MFKLNHHISSYFPIKVFFFSFFLFCLSANELYSSDKGISKTPTKTRKVIKKIWWTPLQLGILEKQQIFKKHFNVNGLRLSVISVENNKLNGLDLGFGQKVDNEMNGLQLSAFYSNSGDVNGFQFSGIFAGVRKGDLKGAQISGFAGKVDKTIYGAQIIGLGSPYYYVSDNVAGFQLVGLVAAVRDTVSGAQIGGVVAYAKSVAGVQLGVVNYCRELKGVQLGCVNIARDSWLPFSIGINLGF